MIYNISVEKDDDQVLAIYIRIHDGKIARTVEIEEGVCYADEDSAGQLLGVELLDPDAISTSLSAIKCHYPSYPNIDELLNRAMETVNV